MRGKLPVSNQSMKSDGITPADAGKTKIFHFLFECGKDHPRGCGEN